MARIVKNSNHMTEAEVGLQFLILCAGSKRKQARYVAIEFTQAM
jgi:hypothetical protein